MEFQDHFSKQASRYTQFRPRYPAKLFEFLASVTPQHDLAWDCGTGNGQAALELAEHFAQVIATDASQSQIDHATAHPRIEYTVAQAEQTPIRDHSVDLVTVAQALHWFQFDKFYAEVRRVSKPGGALACWCYGLASISTAVDAAVLRLYADILGPYWPPDRKYIEERYETIPFPLPRIAAPDFVMQADWTFDDLIGYLSTWSSVQRYNEAHRSDVMATVMPSLLAAWQTPEVPRRVTWKLHLLLGRVS